MNQPLRRLIVTADDFGLSSSANQAIIQAHRDGILTCASLMVNEPGFEEAVALARQNPGLGVGLHLTLLDGHSTLSRSEIPGLVNERREFTGSPFNAGCRYVLFPWLKTQLRAEIKAQFAKFRATGLPIDHVNSHHHFHAHPVIFQIVIGLVREFEIPHMRLTFEPALPALAQRRVAGSARVDQLFHSRMAPGIRKKLSAIGIKHNDFIFGLSQTGQVNEQYLKELVPALPVGVSEIYSHPSLDTFKHELDALLSVSVRDLLKRRDIQTIRFQDL